MPSVTIRGRSIFYTIDESPTSASTTLFVHGLGSSSCFYQTIIQPHLKSVTRCIALDTPGSGLSQLGSSEQTIAAIAEDAIALLDALKISEKVVVVGHSMGGIVVSFLAATYPDRVKGVVLVGPVNPSPAIVPVFEKRIETVKKEGLENLAVTVSTTATGRLAGPFQQAFIRTLILSTSNEGYMSLCRVIAEAKKPNYAEIKVPLLIIAGADDKTAPVSAAEAILDAYGTQKSEKKIEVLSGVGHWHCIEAPVDVERLLKKFILDVA